MESLKATFIAYAFTIVFAMVIAAILPLLGMAVKKLRLDDAEVDMSIPTANSMKEDEAIAVVRPGAPFRGPHNAAMEVLAHGLADLGLLPCSVDEALAEDSKVYARWTLHGTSHMLGMDVHDCAAADPEIYPKGDLETDMVLTVEPGLYFQANDMLVPQELRGIGIRIEDDIVVTADGCTNLSAGLPRDPDEIVEWMGRLRG